MSHVKNPANFKRVLSMVFILAASYASVCSSISAADADVSNLAGRKVKTYSWKEKLSRGALNIISSPVEVARSISIESDQKGMFYGWTVGMVKGIGNGFVRFGVGIIDALTSPFNFPNEHKAPLIEPEYAWEKPGPKYG
jgi:putative exosortase-associated protein (TIGR04073 family)